MTRPVPNSYVLPNPLFVAGEYPGACYTRSNAKLRARLETFLAAGIRAFIDLTATTDPLDPYEPELRSIAHARSMEVFQRADKNVDRPGLLLRLRQHSVIPRLPMDGAGGLLAEKRGQCVRQRGGPGMQSRRGEQEGGEEPEGHHHKSALFKKKKRALVAGDDEPRAVAARQYHG